jgi:hypothetical protein
METTCQLLLVPGLVDSLLKLHLALRFYCNPQLCIGARCLSEHLCANPWAIADALAELADTGLLERTANQGDTEYRAARNRHYSALMCGVARCFDDPPQRDEVYARVRAADQERQFRACQAAEAGMSREIGWGVRV